jgi:hypothetical protein
VLVDNLGTHKVTGVREAIKAVGALVIYLPTCSPHHVALARVSQNAL